MDYSPVLRYIGDYWPRLVRLHPRDHLTLIGLPHPYLVPSDNGAMFQEMYYWDSFFTALGIVGTEHEDLIVAMCENMGRLFRRFGIIPNASRYYFTSRSQPPFSSKMIWLAYSVKERRRDSDARTFLRRMMRWAEAEHESVWLGTSQPNLRQMHRGLSRYFDANFLDSLAACESGWDHTTRCDGLWLSHLPVDLNSILFARELDFARAADLFGEKAAAQVWRTRASERASSIRDLMWDEESGFFYDYNFVALRRNPIPTLAGFYPIWAGLATAEQAGRIVTQWLPRFTHSGGLTASLEGKTGLQWDFPNGWAPLHWLVAEGLDSYGFSEESQMVRRLWCDTCARIFERTGRLWEKYNVVEDVGAPEGGLYGSVPGFGWTNAVFADFVRHLSSNSWDGRTPPG